MIAKYPPLSKTDHVDHFHGATVPDPYKHLEDETNQERNAWLLAQEDLTARFFKESRNELCNFRQLLDQMPDYVPEFLPIEAGGKTFTFRSCLDREGLELVISSPDDAFSVCHPAALDPDRDDRLSPQFTYVSPNGAFAAIGIKEPGSDLDMIRIWSVDRQAFLDDCLGPTANPVAAWLPDESGFYYNRTILNDSERSANGVYLHVIGTPAEQDTQIFDYGSGPGHAAFPHISTDGQYLFIKTLNFVTQKAGLFCRQMTSADDFETLIEDQLCELSIIGVAADTVYLETDWHAPNRRIIARKLARNETPQWHTIIPEGDDPLVRTTHQVSARPHCIQGRSLFLTYSVDASHSISLFDLSGQFVRSLPSSDLSTVLELAPCSNGEFIDVATTSFFSPFRHNRYDVSENKSADLFQVETGLDLGEMEVERHTYMSKDGTDIPLFVAQPKANGTEPCPTLLYGYGGWGSSLTPSFRPELAAWAAAGGAFAVACIRGGGEYGVSWHQAGQKMNKRNCFDDFCAAADYLIEQSITSPDLLAIRGLSNGGLLVTACVNQRPELFSAAVAEVPLVDVVHLMDTAIGPAVRDELGDPTADRHSFDYMRSYSPLQNISKHDDRPAILVVIGEKDERALPSWAYKYVATLQETSAPNQTVLLRRVPNEGHADWPWDIGKTVLAEELTFCRRHLSAPGT